MSIILLELKQEKRKKDLPKNNKSTVKTLALNDFTSDTTDTIKRSFSTIINIILYNNNIF